MKPLVFGLTLFVTTVVRAGDPQWHQGVVVLSNGTVLTGYVAVPSFEVALFRADGVTSVFTPHEINRLHYYDESSNINRKLVTRKDDNGFSLYELVLNGSIQVVRRPRSLLLPAHPSDGHDYLYYYIVNDAVSPLNRFAGSYPQIVNRLSAEDRSALKLLQLSPNRLADAIRIIHFVNQAGMGGEMLAGF